MHGEIYRLEIKASTMYFTNFSKAEVMILSLSLASQYRLDTKSGQLPSLDIFLECYITKIERVLLVPKCQKAQESIQLRL
jgi:hypothetical protein